jgi:hypothetical protein
MKKDVSCVMDFISNTIINSPDQGQKIISNVSLERAGDLLGHVNSLVNSKYDTYLTCGLKATKVLFYKIVEMITE